MSFGSALVAIVAILAFTVMRIVRYNTGHSRDERRHGRSEAVAQSAQAALPSAREAELQREIEDLRERVKVLERITTDAHTTDALQSRSIAAEIESLRDR